MSRGQLDAAAYRKLFYKDIVSIQHSRGTSALLRDLCAPMTAFFLLTLDPTFTRPFKHVTKCMWQATASGLSLPESGTWLQLEWGKKHNKPNKFRLEGAGGGAVKLLVCDHSSRALRKRCSFTTLSRAPTPPGGGCSCAYRRRCCRSSGPPERTSHRLCPA